MKRFRNILAVHDGCAGSAAVLEQAVSLAQANGARLTVFAPLDDKRTSLRDQEEARKRLLHIQPWIREQGVEEVATEVHVGPAYPEIVHRVAHDRHDLVILGANDGRGFPDVFFGTLATSLMRSCPCPVWALKPGGRIPCAHVLAAIGPQTNDPSEHALNAKILGLATAIAHAEAAKLHVVHAWEPAGDGAECLKSELPRERRNKIMRQSEAKCRGAVNALLDCDVIAGLDHEIHLPRGLPQLTIIDLASRLDADLVVMGSHGCRGARRFFAGRRAESILGNVRCGVLTVKPDGFQPVSMPYDPPPRRTAQAALAGR